MTINPSDT